MIYDYLINKLHTYNPYYGFNSELYPKLKNIPGWHGNHNVFRDIISILKPENILEIGSWKGQSAIHMGSIVKELGLNTTIVCVDTWLGSVDFIGAENILDRERDCYPLFGYPQVYYHFLANVINYNMDDIIVPFPQTSSIACQWFKKHKITFDMIYVDGSNDLEDITFDLNQTWPLLNTNGYIFGDDFNNQAFPSIKTAIQQYTELNNVTYELTDDGLFWMIHK